VNGVSIHTSFGKTILTVRLCEWVTECFTLFGAGIGLSGCLCGRMVFDRAGGMAFADWLRESAELLCEGKAYALPSIIEWAAEWIAVRSTINYAECELPKWA
jgi:hypothetical protein